MPTPEPDVVVGFDPAADGDTFLVVARRGGDGSWRVDQVDGPAPADLAEQVADWIRDYADGGGKPVTLTAEQMSVVEGAYAALVREGRLTHRPRGFSLDGRQTAAALLAPLPNQPR